MGKPVNNGQIMGIRTGNPKGRPIGAKNARSVARTKVLEEAEVKMRAVIANMFDGDAHMLLISVYKDLDQPLPVRIDAAKAAIRYEVPALATMEYKKDEKQFAAEQAAEAEKLANMDIKEVARRIAFIFAEAQHQPTKSSPESRVH